MIELLSIRDLAVVERADIPFGPGLNAVTGETGAGKSLLVQAVSLLVGGRADSDTVREGAESATVEGTFRLAGETAKRAVALLAEWGAEDDGETVIVRREVRRDGRSRAFVNQSSVTLASLKSLGEVLADLHGQHEHQSLLRADAGVMVLDRLGALEEERARFDEQVAAVRQARDQHARLEASIANLAERADYLRDAAHDLDDAHLRDGEEAELARDAARLAHADRLRTLVAGALEKLSEGEEAAVSRFGSALHALEQAAAIDPGLEAALPALREAEIAAADAARTLAGYVDGLEADPAALEEIEARRDRITRLTRKYRRTVPELIAWHDEVARELATADDTAGAIARSRAALEHAEAGARAAGEALTVRRREAADLWGPKLAKELKPLGMAHARFEFVLEPSAADAVTDAEQLGALPVAMRFGANPGEPLRALQRIASGGELSRVMLALKAALETRDRVDLLFFDEVDSGIGGAVAQAVGERLRRLARHRQIVCVTHLPMIAALAGHHLRVTKQASGGRTIARIAKVEEDERVAELARMLAGDRVTETTRRQARELLAAR
jgi:DNA repair protein RecN (Recombination protein N)